MLMHKVFSMIKWLLWLFAALPQQSLQ